MFPSAHGRPRPTPGAASVSARGGARRPCRVDGPGGTRPAGRLVTGLPSVGQLVLSRAGRDRGAALVVLAVVDARHVLCSDGALRPEARPKRKNVRHLAATTAIHPGVAVGRPPNDAELRRWISVARGAAGDAVDGSREEET